MSTFTNLKLRIAAWWRRVSPAVTAAEKFLATLLTREHIEAGYDAVLAVRNEDLSGFQKAEKVADTLKGISDLPAEAKDAIGAVVGALHMVAKARGFL